MNSVQRTLFKPTAVQFYVSSVHQNDAEDRRLATIFASKASAGIDVNYCGITGYVDAERHRCTGTAPGGGDTVW